MKYELHFIDEENPVDFHKMQELLWAQQRQVREILNKTIQYSYAWMLEKQEYRENTGSYPDKAYIKEKYGYNTFDGYIYNCLKDLKDEYPYMISTDINAAVQTAYKKYKGFEKDILKGTVSIPSYKGNQPLVINDKNIKIEEDGKDVTVVFSFFSQAFKAQTGLDSRLKFRVNIDDKTQRSIIERVLGGEYKVSQSQLRYQDKKWIFYLGYSFEKKPTELDKDKILGIDLGVVNTVYAASFYSEEVFRIDGREADKVKAQIRILEDLKKSKQRQARYCGEGRIGHGTKTRVSSVYLTQDKISNMQDTYNHRWSKAIVDFAVKNGFGTIQMEDLSGIKEDTGFPKYLQHWKYYDLQNKIKYKAEAEGIEVIKIVPGYTSQRCSQCGYIDKANRPSQSEFICQKCGFKENADKNAAINISIKDIDKIIEEDKPKDK